ncbi:MAG: hypothetical protein MJE77_13325 [Proteobacteria bacterium]|nr:hypothetical protein [Pseudomonadota bacterium]
MSSKPRYAAGIVLALAFLFASANALGRPLVFQIPVAPAAPKLTTWNSTSNVVDIDNGLGRLNAFDSPSVLTSDRIYRQYDENEGTYIDTLPIGQSIRALPVYDGPESKPGLALDRALNHGGLSTVQDNDDHDTAVRDARAMLIQLLRRAATRSNRYWVKYHYREAHKLLIDDEERRTNGLFGYELLYESQYTVPDASWTHVYGDPVSKANSFTTKKIFLPKDTVLYVLVTKGTRTLVAQPDSKVGDGAFIGWIPMTGISKALLSHGAFVAIVIPRKAR